MNIDQKTIERLEQITGKKARISGKTIQAAGAAQASRATQAGGAAKKRRPVKAGQAEIGLTDNLMTNLEVSQATQPRRGVEPWPEGTEGEVIQQGQTRHKFSARKVVNDGIEFASRLESTRYDELKALQLSGEVIGFLRQVPVPLGARTSYRMDFLVFWRDGRVTFEDTKGRETPEFRAKMQIIRDMHPWITIHLLKRRSRR